MVSMEEMARLFDEWANRQVFTVDELKFVEAARALDSTHTRIAAAAWYAATVRAESGVDPAEPPKEKG